jgi:FMN-dependent NADH-azoreductase
MSAPLSPRASSSGYLLRVEVSPMGAHSNSKAVGDAFVEAYTAAHPDHTVRTRELGNNQVQHLDAEAIFFGHTPEDARSESMKAKNDVRLDLIKEITNADAILITTPMWNWTIPSSLKSYIDQLVYPGVFDPYYNRKLEGKKVTVCFSCGGHNYGPGQDRESSDFGSKYLEFIFGKLGSTDVKVIRNEYGFAAFPGAGYDDKAEARAESSAAAKAEAAARARE